MHGAVEIPVGGGDDPHVDRKRLGAAQRANLALLQYAQQLDLQRQRHVADLVEEQRAAVGSQEQAFVLADRAGEGAASVTEQLALQQLLRQRAAVDRHERLVGTRAGLVHGVGEKLLACTTGAGHQHADIGGGDHVGLFENALHLRAAGNDLRTPRFPALASRGRSLLERFVDRFEQFVAIDRLGQEAEHALSRGADGIRNRTVGGENDHRDARHPPLQLVEQGQTIHFVHAQIGQHQIRRGLFDVGQRFATALRRGHPEAAAFQAHAQQLEQAGVVVDQENVGGVAALARLHGRGSHRSGLGCFDIQ